MTILKGRGVRVEFAKTFGTPKTVTEVTAAKPPACSSTGHGLLAKSIGYFAVATGMPQLEGQSCRLKVATTDGFTLEDLDTTLYGDFTAGSFVPVTAWSLFAESTDYAKSGGDASSQDVTTLAHLQNRNDTGNPGAESLQISAYATEVASEALQIAREAARASSFVLVRITMKSGTVRHCCFNPGQPSENLGKGGAPGTTSLTGDIVGYWCEGDA